ncbi:sensor histidine kinase [Deinococcus koreensis]|uniref:histidine kinase n=1 Tax=Deinococcus koreensis TaxID=2054903 RepID=A0A2K3UWD2_9DEIO|nr:HAMP domain-containing sensor histidine kinase [Deinococcus koreensis]PNY80849.1 sensor histidine kinase [Deinococcus koreensis]
MTLRARLTLLTSLVLALTLLASLGVAGGVLWRVELRSIGQQIDAQAEALLAIATTTPERLDATARDILQENGVTAAARVYRGSTVIWTDGSRRSLQPDPGVLQGQQTRVVRQVGDLLIASQRSGPLSVEVGRSLEPLERLLRRYALIAGLTLLALSALAGLVVARMVRRALSPLEALAGRVQGLEWQSLRSAGPLPALTDAGEVGALARALDGSLSALRAERERETLFLASASHELRTPVTAMLADVQHTLSRPRPEAELRSTLERTERTASRLRLLTGNLITLTRAQRLPAAQDAPTRALDLLQLAGEAVDLLQPLAMRRSLDLWLDGAAVWVRGDHTLLGSMAENLIGNAIKFTPPGGRITVTVRPAGAHATLSVEDSGPGFPAGTLTDAFVRGATQVEGQVEGFGLGLAVVRQVVEAHGGTLELGRAGGSDGTEEPGARVVVTLPAAPEPATDRARSGADPAS